MPTGGTEWPGLDGTLHSTLSPSSFLILCGLRSHPHIFPWIGDTLMASFYFDHLFKDLASIYISSEVLGAGAPTFKHGAQFSSKVSLDSSCLLSQGFPGPHPDLPICFLSFKNLL